MSYSKTPVVARLVLTLLVVGTAGSFACRGGSDPAPTPTPTATAVSTSTPTATATASPTVTPTPDHLAAAPGSAAEAASGLDRYLRGAGPGCAGEVVSRWEAICHEADLDRDGAADAAYLIPLRGGSSVAASPAVVFIDRASVSGLEQFPVRDDTDSSELGLSLFALEDRSGDGAPELVLLAMRCGASNCQARVEVQTWDGTAWRDIGPGQPGFDNPEWIEWQGVGATSQLVAKAGVLRSVGAGPTRASTLTYALEAGMYQQQSAEPDPPVYLFHAILDADALFDEGDFPGAISAYGEAIANDELEDWYADIGRPPGKPALEGYALFRIAVAMAAMGADPTAAMDAVILNSEEPLFVEAIQAFRRGYQDASSVTKGCLEATRYLLTPGAEATLIDRFDYGYGNPRKAPEDICPL